MAQSTINVVAIAGVPRKRDRLANVCKQSFQENREMNDVYILRIGAKK